MDLVQLAHALGAMGFPLHAVDRIVALAALPPDGKKKKQFKDDNVDTSNVLVKHGPFNPAVLKAILSQQNFDIGRLSPVNRLDNLNPYTDPDFQQRKR